VASGGLRISDFPDLHFVIDQGDGRWQVGIKARTSPAISSLFFRAGWGGALTVTERVEALENESAVIAEEFMKADHPEQNDGVVVITLNAFAFTSGTLHPVILAIAGDLRGHKEAQKALY
jgi:hypothetical protein